MAGAAWGPSDARESAKLIARRALGRAGLGIVGDPFVARVARTIEGASIDTVLDVGANVGQYAVLLRSHGFGGAIHSFEPLTAAADRLEKRAAGDRRWQVHRRALGAQAATSTLHVAGNSYSSSLRDMTDEHVRADPDSAYVEAEQVAVSTVAAEVEALGLDPARCLLKIDTQGYEAEVLDGAGETLPRFAAVQTELSLVELYAGQQLADGVLTTLRDAGYGLWGLEPGIADADGRLLQCDALMVNRAGPLGHRVVNVCG